MANERGSAGRRAHRGSRLGFTYVIRGAVAVGLLDTGVSSLAGLVIVSVVFAGGGDSAAGPGASILSFG